MFTEDEIVELLKKFINKTASNAEHRLVILRLTSDGLWARLYMKLLQGDRDRL